MWIVGHFSIFFTMVEWVILGDFLSPLTQSPTDFYEAAYFSVTCHHIKVRGKRSVMESSETATRTAGFLSGQMLFSKPNHDC